MRTDHQKRALRNFLFCLVIILATFIAFEQVRHNQFVYDDFLYVVENPNVANGLSADSIKWAFTTIYAGNWHPVTWLSHMLDCEFFGLEPYWPHMENLLLHILNTLLLFWILKSVTGAFWRSAFVAAIFAIHPFHVESVAWVAERKDLLCGLFWMLTAASYIRYARKPGFGRYLFVVIFFILGLMSKPMIVTLPLVLLLMDYWPLTRFKKLQPVGAGDEYKKTSVWFLLLEKLPLFILVIASSVITFIAQRGHGAVTPLETMTFGVRITNALVSYITYMSKMIYPSRLAVLYPHPGGELGMWYALTSLGLILLVSIIAICLGRRKPYLFFGWFWYLGTLVPVIGFVQIGAQSMADRYTYLPSIGFFIVVIWGVAEIAGNKRFLKVGLGISAVIAIALLTVSTRKQVEYWKNNFTLFERALTVTGNNPSMLYNIGVVLETEHQIDLALRCYREALKLYPGYFEAYCNIGNILWRQGKLEDATDNIRKALKINPEYPQAHNSLGLVLVAQGNLSEALVHFRRAVELMPSSVEMRHNLASVLQAKGELDEAMNHYRKVLQLNPNYLFSLQALAGILITHPVQEQRNPDEAVLLAEKAAELTNHQNLAVLETLGAAYAAAGQFENAVATMQEAINLSPDADRFKKRLDMYKQGKLPEELIQKKDISTQ